PSAAVTLMVTRPAFAPASAAMVRVAVPPGETEVALSLPERPAGSASKLSASAPGVPDTTEVAMVSVVDEPAFTTVVPGLSETEKSLRGGGGAVVVTVTFALAVWLPDGALPVTVNCVVPSVAGESAVSVGTALAPDGALALSEAPVPPRGRPETASATVSGEPIGVVVTRTVVDEPACTVASPAMLRPKSACGGGAVPLVAMHLPALFDHSFCTVQLPTTAV